MNSLPCEFVPYYFKEMLI